MALFFVIFAALGGIIVMARYQHRVGIRPPLPHGVVIQKLLIDLAIWGVSVGLLGWLVYTINLNLGTGTWGILWFPLILVGLVVLRAGIWGKELQDQTGLVTTTGIVTFVVVAFLVSHDPPKVMRVMNDAPNGWIAITFESPGIWFDEPARCLYYTKEDALGSFDVRYDERREATIFSMRQDTDPVVFWFEGIERGTARDRLCN